MVEDKKRRLANIARNHKIRTRRLGCKQSKQDKHPWKVRVIVERCANIEYKVTVSEIDSLVKERIRCNV